MRPLVITLPPQPAIPAATRINETEAQKTTVNLAMSILQKHLNSQVRIDLTAGSLGQKFQLACFGMGKRHYNATVSATRMSLRPADEDGVRIILPNFLRC